VVLEALTMVSVGFATFTALKFYGSGGRKRQARSQRSREICRHVGPGSKTHICNLHVQPQAQR